MNRVFLALAFVCCSGSLRAAEPAATHAVPTTLQSVLHSALTHYPSIQAAQSAVAGSQARVLAAEGSFDPRIEGRGSSRLSGYYDGSSLDSSVVQEFPLLNARVFAGYAASNGDFPSYEGSYATLNGGETRVGFSLSLLRDREIDEQRAAVTDSLLDVSRELASLNAEKLDVLREAWVVYARWLLSARLYESYTELLQVAEDRGQALQTRVTAGDAPEILLVENRQAILQWQGRVVQAERQLEMAAEQLSLYLRNGRGDPVYPLYDAALQMPAEASELLEQPVSEIVSRVLGLRPEIRSLEQARQQADLDKQLARNARLPKLDFEYYLKRDTGSGPLSLTGTDNVAAVSFSIPLRNRRAAGREAEADAEIARLEHSLRLLRQQLEVEVRQSHVNLQATRELEELALQELEVSRALAEAERQRFASGLSDFFLLNVRERQMGEAQLKRWQAHLEHQVALADFYQASMSLEQFTGESGSES